MLKNRTRYKRFKTFSLHFTNRGDHLEVLVAIRTV